MGKKILHLASFNGNVGDLLNHEGFYRGLNENNCSISNIQHMEIREFYRGKCYFDQTFVDYVNKFDLCIIGGGNYFELWVDHSPSGTSIMLEPQLVSKIKTPLIFNALGVDLGQGTSDTNIKKFKNFIDEVLKNDENILSIRNDGAKENLVTIFGSKYAEQFIHTPDAGFNSKFHVEKNGKRICLVNLPGDMLDNRFPGGDLHSLDSFIVEFARVIMDVLESDFVDEVTFIPHIYKDYITIMQLLGRLPDNIIRERCRVAELNLGNDLSLFKHYYSNASIVLASRFHSNIAGLMSCDKVIALQNYPQITNLYTELALTEKLLNVQDIGFFDRYQSGLRSNIFDHDRVLFTDKIQLEYRNYIQKIQHMFN